MWATGASVSPSPTRWATPRSRSSPCTAPTIARLLRKHAVAEAVVGNPLHVSGDQSPQAAKAQQFAEELRSQFGLTVHLWDERLTTTEAHRHLDAGGHAAGRERSQIIDQVAAVLILQSFLDARANRTAQE